MRRLPRESLSSRQGSHRRLVVVATFRRLVSAAAGTRRIYQVDPDALAILRAYFESFWNRSLATFRELADSDHRKETCADDPTRG